MTMTVILVPMSYGILIISKNTSTLLYTELLTSGKFHGYLVDLSEEGIEMKERLVKQMVVQQCINEQLKAAD